RRLYMPYHIEGDHPVELVEAAVTRVETWLLENKEELDIRSVYSYYEGGHAESVILLTDARDAKLSRTEIISKIEEGLPALTIGKPNFQFDQQGGGEGFSLLISGDSTERLNELGADVIRTLASVEGLSALRSDADSGNREVRVTVDRIRAASVGL